MNGAREIEQAILLLTRVVARAARAALRVVDTAAYDRDCLLKLDDDARGLMGKIKKANRRRPVTWSFRP